MSTNELAFVSVALLGGALAGLGCSSSTSGTGDSPNGVDAAVGDASVDAHGGAEASTTFDSGGGDGGGAASCSPSGISGYAGPAYHPAGQTVGACSTTDLQGYFDACLGPANTEAACADYEPGGTSGTQSQRACGACIDGTTLADGGVLTGVLVSYFPMFGALESVNIPGCIQFADPSSTGTACATAWQQAEICVGFDCKGCDAADDPMGTATAACSKTSVSGNCASYFSTIDSTCSDLADGGAAAVCIAGNSYESSFLAVGAELCGGS